MTLRSQTVLARIADSSDPTTFAEFVRYDPHEERVNDYGMKAFIDRSDDGGAPESFATYIGLNRSALAELLHALADELGYDITENGEPK